MSRPKAYKKQTVLEAIKDSYGVKSTIAKRLGCDWHTADQYIKKWPETLQLLEDEGECILDLAENKAIERLKAADGQMIRFVLATKGKKRGYSYDNEVAADENAPDTEINIDVGGGEPAPIGFTSGTTESDTEPVEIE